MHRKYKTLLFLLIAFISFFVFISGVSAQDGFCIYQSASNSSQTIRVSISGGSASASYSTTGKYGSSLANDLSNHFKSINDCGTFNLYMESDRSMVSYNSSVVNNPVTFTLRNTQATSSSNSGSSSSSSSSGSSSSKTDSSSSGSTTTDSKTNEKPTVNANSGKVGTASTERLDSKDDGFAFCESQSVLSALRFLGLFIIIAKILVPILLIVFGSIDFAKVVISGDDSGFRKSLTALIFRLLAGISIFFIPTIVYMVINLITSFQDIQSENQKCYDCVFELDCNMK